MNATEKFIYETVLVYNSWGSVEDGYFVLETMPFGAVSVFANSPPKSEDFWQSISERRIKKVRKNAKNESKSKCSEKNN